MLGQSSLGEKVYWTFSVAAESARGTYPFPSSLRSFSSNPSEMKESIVYYDLNSDSASRAVCSVADGENACGEYFFCLGDVAGGEIAGWTPCASY